MHDVEGLEIAICKPNHGIVGGFERVVDAIAAELTRSGARVTPVSIDAHRLRQRLTAGGATEADVHEQLVREFAALDLSNYDMAISTQPPSYAIRHRRHLAIFYHHLRLYYDLSDLYVQSFGVDPEEHAAQVQRIRTVDDPLLHDVDHFLVGSNEIAARLALFNGIEDKVGLFTAGPSIAATARPTPVPTDGSVVCVSRMEWPKRTELVVQALALAPDRSGVFVGDGGRRWFNEEVAALCAAGAVDASRLGAEDLWLHDGRASTGLKPPARYTFLGHVPDADLDRAYADAFCVVAPAYREDYGLTAVETMMRARPLIVCADGGGLVEFVRHDQTGLIVEPTGDAIAAAIARLGSEAGLAQRLGTNAHRAAEAFSWELAHQQLQAGLQAVLEA